MNAVHSRLGVTFTALVEIAVSTVTSLSVCALVGFKVTLVPWYAVPLSEVRSIKKSTMKGAASHSYRLCWSRKHVHLGKFLVLRHGYLC
jgi:hypothetical protein